MDKLLKRAQEICTRLRLDKYKDEYILTVDSIILCKGKDEICIKNILQSIIHCK